MVARHFGITSRALPVSSTRAAADVIRHPEASAAPITLRLQRAERLAKKDTIAERVCAGFVIVFYGLFGGAILFLLCLAGLMLDALLYYS